MSFKFGSRIRELRIHLCQKGGTSEGARNFITKYYVDLKKQNGKFPILVRECQGVEPKVWARYEKGKEISATLTNLQAEDVLKTVQRLAQ